MSSVPETNPDAAAESAPTEDFRCGQVAIVGRPNVGKSSLLNSLIGTKISIVSRKAQTTRQTVQGVLTTSQAQYVFVDTPGFQTRHSGRLNRHLNRLVTDALAAVSVIVWVVEAGRFSAPDQRLIPLLPAGPRLVLALNKVDQLANASQLFPFTQQILDRMAQSAASRPIDAVVPISALQIGRGAIAAVAAGNTLLEEIRQGLPLGPAWFDADTLTDRSERFLAAEFIREKIFRCVGDELPYGCAVLIERWEVMPNQVHISACIWVERSSHRPILLGAKGLHLKRIGTEARVEIERLIGNKVFLELFIKVRGQWAEHSDALRELGFDA